MTTKHEEVQAQLDAWSEEYHEIFIDPCIACPAVTVYFTGYKDMGLTMGLCESWMTLSTITLGHKFEHKKFGWLERSVLWHEMSHSIAYHEDKIGDKHNDHWKEIQKHKPMLVLGDWLAKFSYIFMRS